MKYLISDTHFFHYRIIEYCDRPFKNIIEMNNAMIEKWNSTVHPDDTVIHLGDFGFGPASQISNMLSLLNGQKILIIGNHDRRNGGKSYWERMGFKEAHSTPIVLDDEIILSHAPIIEEELKKYKMNFHGHLHNKDMENTKYKNFSVERINYTPVPIEYETITKK